MKIISYSLFKGSDPLAELFYVRGLYFNVLMNSIVYPGWETILYIDQEMMRDYDVLIMKMMENYNFSYWVVGNDDDPHCKKMLWRMKAVFEGGSEYVICRDADALTSKREADAVNRFVSSDAIIHGISDNRAHSIPLMGGMCGFKCADLRAKYGDFENMINGFGGRINEHGTDQNFLTQTVYKDFKHDLMMHFGSDAEENEDKFAMYCSNSLGEKLHGSDLCTSFIGSAGVNEMETLRFFRSNLPGWTSDQELWKQYPQIFYWYE